MVHHRFLVVDKEVYWYMSKDLVLHRQEAQEARVKDDGLKTTFQISVTTENSVRR